MSVAAMAWAWKQRDINSTQKLVLVALADHADDEGICWPGQSGIAEKCELSRQTVNSAIKLLESKELLKIIQRSDQYGRPLSNRYRLSLKQGGNVKEDDTPTVSDDDSTVSQDDTIRHPEPSKKEPSVRASARLRATTLSDDFTLDESDIRHAKAKGMTDADIAEQLERFKNNHIGKRNRWVDWHRAWKNWASGFHPPANNRASPAPREFPNVNEYWKQEEQRSHGRNTETHTAAKH